MAFHELADEGVRTIVQPIRENVSCGFEYSRCLLHLLVEVGKSLEDAFEQLGSIRFCRFENGEYLGLNPRKHIVGRGAISWVDRVELF